jgi:hypothetical protein
MARKAPPSAAVIVLPSAAFAGHQPRDTEHCGLMG